MLAVQEMTRRLPGMPGQDKSAAGMGFRPFCAPPASGTWMFPVGARGPRCRAGADGNPRAR